VTPFATLPGERQDATIRDLEELFHANFEVVPDLAPLTQETPDALGAKIGALRPVTKMSHVPHHVGRVAG
jgi:hypothetical protein